MLSVGIDKSNNQHNKTDIHRDACLLYTNANGFQNKLKELKVVLSTKKYKIVCITETHLHKVPDSDVEIPQFEIFREDRNAVGKRGPKGGSMVYVHQSYDAKRLKFFDNMESLALEITNDKGHSFVLVCVYRSCNLSEATNHDIISEFIRLSNFAQKEILVVGDVNLPDVDWNIGSVTGPLKTVNKKLVMQQDMLDCFLDNGFSWYLNNSDVTRRRLVANNLQESSLDQILYTKKDFVLHFDKLAPFGKSDHIVLAVTINFKTSVEDLGMVSSTKKMWAKYDDQNLLDYSSSIDWEYSSPDLSVEEMWTELYSKFELIEDQVPVKIQKRDRYGNLLKDIPWDTAYLVRKRKEKDKAWAQFDLDPCTNTFYTALSKQDAYEIVDNESRTKHEAKIVKNLKYNCKPLFHYINSQQKSKVHVSKLKKDDGQFSSTPQEIVEILANHFQSVFKLEEFGPLPRECYATDKSDLYDGQDATLHASFEKVQKLLSGVDRNKAIGPDRMPPKFPKVLSDDLEFVKAVSILFNRCIEQECIPTPWKTAHVVPVHKKESYVEKENYRPVSLTCILSKVYERFLSDHILDQIADKLSKHQHGFRKKRSCLSNLLETLEQLMSSLNQNEKADILYFDFSKAFDSVSHYKLLLKLENIGLSAKVRSIIKDFLTDRKFLVKVGDVLNLPSNWYFQE